MVTSTHAFLIQSRDGKWAVCSAHPSTPTALPFPVLHAAQLVYRILDATGNVEEVKNRYGVDAEFPDDLTLVPIAKLLIGEPSPSMPKMAFSSLGNSLKKSKPARYCFAYVDLDSKFYLGMDSREFSNVAEE